MGNDFITCSANSPLPLPSGAGCFFWKILVLLTPHDGDADFIRLVYTSAVSERGEGIEFWRSELRDTDERRALVGMADCGNGSIYVGPVLRSPN